MLSNILDLAGKIVTLHSFYFDCYRMGSLFLSMREKHFLRIVHSKVKYLFFPEEMVFI